MNQICAKIYYDVSIGNILVVTTECEGAVEATTKEQDITIYPELKDKNINELDFIELEYGTLATIFNNSKSYKVNLDTKQLEVTYYTEEELNAMQQQDQQTQQLSSRVSDISTYLNNSDENTITDIENSILEVEKNKIINGGM